MDSEQIFKLIDAGFTAEEIRKMEAPKEEPKSAPGSEETGPKEQGQADPPHESAVGSDVLAELSKTVSELANTVKDMQANNINNANGGKKPIKDAVQETIDSFIKEL